MTNKLCRLKLSIEADDVDRDFQCPQNKGTTKTGWLVKEITDGCVYIQTIFTKTAVEKCLGDNGTSLDLNSAVLLLRDIRLELQYNSTNEAEFVLIVDDFVIWDHQRGFKLTKTSIQSCMEDSRVQDAVKLYVSTHGHAEMIDQEDPIAFTIVGTIFPVKEGLDWSINYMIDSRNPSISEEDWVVKLTKPFDVKEFIIPNAAENILKGLKEWDADYRIPASCSGDMVIQSSSVEGYSMGRLNTFVEPKQHEDKDVCEMNKDQPSPEKLLAPESSTGYNQAQSEISCWQACMDSVQLSDESLDIGQPDAHSTQVEKGPRSQDLPESQRSQSSDGANDSIICSNGEGEIGEQSSSVEIIEKNNSVILVSSGSENIYNTLPKGSLEKVKQHDQAELKRLGALSVTSNNVSDGEFSHSELYKTSVLDKHLETNLTTEPQNKGSEDLFVDSTTTEEHSGKSCDKSENKNNDISQAFGNDQQDTSENISLLIDSNDCRNLPECLRCTENKENENSQVDGENGKNSQITNISTKANFGNIMGGSRSTIQRLRLCQELLRKNNTVCKTKTKHNQSCINTQQTCTVRSPECSSDSLAKERQYSEFEKSVMWNYYSEKSPVKSHNFTNKLDNCDRDETVDNDSEVISTPVYINTQLTTLNPITPDRKLHSEKQNDTLSLHTNYEFTQTDNVINSEKKTNKVQYMNSLELSPIKVSDEPVNLNYDVDELVEITDQVQPINPEPVVTTGKEQVCKSKRIQPTNTYISLNSNTMIHYDRLSSRPCFVVLERLTKDVLDSWNPRETEQNDKRGNLDDDSTESLELYQNKRILCKRSNTAKTWKTKRSGIAQQASSITESSPQINQNKIQKEEGFETNQSLNGSKTTVTENSDKQHNMDSDDAVCSTQPFITVVTQSQGFSPMSQDKELAYLGPFVVSNFDADSFRLISNIENAETQSAMDDRETDVIDKDCESIKFLNQQTNRKAAIDRIKLTRKKYAQKLGIDIERLSNKIGNKKQDEENMLDITVDSCIYNEVDVKETDCVGKEELRTNDNVDGMDEMEIATVTEISNDLEKKSFGVLSLQQSQNIELAMQADQDLLKNNIEQQFIGQISQNIDDNEKEVHERQSISLSNSTRQALVVDKTPAFISSLQHNEHFASASQVNQSLLKRKEKIEKNDNKFKGNELENVEANTTDDENTSNIDSFESSEIPVYNECVGQSVETNTNNGQCETKFLAINKKIFSLDKEKHRKESVTNENTQKKEIVINETFTIPINGTHKKSELSMKNKTSEPYSEGRFRSNFVTNKTITIPVNGKCKGIESLTNHERKRKRNESIAVESETDLSRKDSASKRVCLETSKTGSSFNCSDAEMDYLLSKCPSKSKLLDYPKSYSPVRNVSSDRSILITLFPAMKALEKEYKLNAVNKEKRRKRPADGFFSIPLKKLRRQHRRTVVIAPESEKIESGSNSEEKSEYEDSLFGFMQVAKARKQSLHAYSVESRRQSFGNQSPNKDTAKSSTQVCEVSYIDRPSTSTGVGKLSNNTGRRSKPFTAGNPKAGQVRSNLRLTVDQSTGACRFSRLGTLGQSSNVVQLHKEPVHPSSLKGKGPAKNSKQECKGKQSNKELCRGEIDENKEAEKSGELNIKMKSGTATGKDNKQDAVSCKTDGLITSDESNETNSDKYSEIIIGSDKKTGSQTNNKQKGDVKKGASTNSDEFSGTNKSKANTDIDRKSNQMTNDRSEGDELPQRSLRKRKNNVVTLTRESLKIHDKGQVNKDLFLQEWLETSNFGASSEDDD